jgi:predicted secreted Zn-dependent protease
MQKLWLVIALLALAGCKIEIVMPVGGSLTSDSGLYGCAAGETCVINVDHVFFTESFVAVPATGFAFSHWEKKPGSFCGDRQLPDCSNFGTLRFPNFPALMALLDSDTVYTMTPVFTILDGTPVVSDGTFNISSEHRQANYSVDGDSEAELLVALQSSANPLELDPGTGAKPVAQATPETTHGYSWSWSSNGNVCALVSYSFEINYVTTMPQLLDLGTRAAGLQAEWLDYYARVEAHEAGHQEINRAQHQVQLAALQQLLDPYTGDIESFEACGAAVAARWSAIMEPLSAQTEQLQDDYHTLVGASTPWSAD